MPTKLSIIFLCTISIQPCLSIQSSLIIKNAIRAQSPILKL